MERLTHPRSSGIKTGYWSPNKKDELVERLAAYEDTGLTPEEIERLKEQNRWIPVEERLPEEVGIYLVTFSIDKKMRLVAYGCCRKNVLGNDIGFGWYDLYRGTYFSKEAIAAWMPLPEPYKPEN